ncbi:Gfo/Idh/MocA family oxidoreductase [Lacticaseibacillus pabuli]|uniref:Gfo/Idh/MocA family oxidoreductase n=1 Tax=Lacticaseibacillus pabuli TaxID=3025672 RepID=A0ABY7WW93_9LACO|nr:Gfo/Idh/MocA family oxidoreductase [Lacticaseibacillus sp. KACC 23028]WDF83319.1 Gfo/Idh/MocA family oxidoreductase [Lacticaseibacillus sp. KACC 23028]
MDKITVAYIGNGKSTNRYHLPFILKLQDRFQVKTIYARHHSDAWTPIAGVHYTTNIDDVLDDPEVSLVVITTPPAPHFELATQVLNHGKNVLVEKPFTETSEQARQLFALGKEKGLLVQCYQNRRFDSDFLTLQKVIESGKLGDLYEVESTFDYFRPEVPTHSKFSVLGSFLYGHATHTLDQVISYFGKPDATHYDLRQLMGPGHMNDYFDIDMNYGPVMVSVRSSYFRIKPRPSFIATGTKGQFVKQSTDRQEFDLKHFYMPSGHPDFGVDRPEDYGVLTYMDAANQYHEERVVSEVGDYSRVYANLYATLKEGRRAVVTPEQTILQMTMLEEGIAPMAAREQQ